MTVNVYVYIYIYEYIYTYRRIHTYIHTYIYIYDIICNYTSTNIFFAHSQICSSWLTRIPQDLPSGWMLWAISMASRSWVINAGCQTSCFSYPFMTGKDESHINPHQHTSTYINVMNPISFMNPMTLIIPWFVMNPHGFRWIPHQTIPRSQVSGPLVMCSRGCWFPKTRKPLN